MSVVFLICSEVDMKKLVIFIFSTEAFLLRILSVIRDLVVVIANLLSKWHVAVLKFIPLLLNENVSELVPASFYWPEEAVIDILLYRFVERFPVKVLVCVC